MSDIKTIQQLLANHGFDPGPVDGQWGRRSQKALVAALQAAQAGPGDDGEDDAELIAELCEDEGTIFHAYQDHKGFWTLGTGRLIDKRRGGGISKAENDYLLRNDIRRFRQELDARLPWWRQLDPVRQRAIQNLAFNMGIENLLGFRNTLPAIRAGDWARAAVGLKASDWAKQVQPSRRDRIIRQIKTGA
jgi:lysozyme